MRIFILAFGVVFLSNNVMAWGPQGHKVVARIAEKRLSAKAKAAVQNLLHTSLAEVATWADEVRPQRQETGAWHFINIPITGDWKGTAAFCGAAGNCVTAKVTEFTEQLRKRQGTPTQQAEALKFLVHFVGDMHQPLHCSDNGDRGGNSIKVQFFDKQTNLHSLWDSGIIGKFATNEDDLLAKSEKKINFFNSGALKGGTVETWAKEAREASIKNVYQPLPKSGSIMLALAYQQQAEPVIERQLARAGMRLARILNEIYK